MILRLVLLTMVLTLSTALVVEQADGLVEFKKYKVTNSPKVCGDKMCSEIDEERAKKGFSSRQIEVCGDRPCYEISADSEKPFNDLEKINDGELPDIPLKPGDRIHIPESWL